MTLYDEWGTETPVTVLQMDHVTVVDHKTPERDGYTALQIGAGPRKEKNVNKPMAGHYAKHEIEPRHVLCEFRVSPEAVIPIGALQLVTFMHYCSPTLFRNGAERGPLCPRPVRRHRRHHVRASFLAHLSLLTRPLGSARVSRVS